jgi:hypothetical protein
MLLLHEIVGCLALGRQTRVEPVERRHHPWILIAQPLNQLNDESRGQDSVVEMSEDEAGGLGFSGADSQQSVRQCIGDLACRASCHDAFRQPPKIFDEDNPQGDRDRPKLANRQGLDPLIGANEAAQHLGIETAVGMGNERPGHPEDARISLERPVGQFWQLSIVAPRQIALDLVDLLVDHVKIIDQPIGGRRYGALLGNRDGYCLIGRAQYPVIVPKTPRQAPVRQKRRHDALSGGETFAVLLEPLKTEQLGPNGLFGSIGKNGGTTPKGASDKTSQYRDSLSNPGFWPRSIFLLYVIYVIGAAIGRHRETQGPNGIAP